jgi:hypothetical protein
MGEGFVSREVPFEDRHMWRLLLARVHPDAGGDHELFLFAHALKEACGDRRPEDTSTPDHDNRGTERGAEPFLRAWHDTMGCWALRNREALKCFVLSETPLAPAGS